MHHFKIGLRTLKTAISVALCVIICWLVKRDNPVLACLAAVYCLRTDPTSSLHFSKHRLFGTFVGVIVSMLSIVIQQIFIRSVFVDAFVAFSGAILVIVICNLAKHPEGIITAMSTFLIICFNTPYTESIGYAMFRLLDVTMGATVAVVIDWLLPSKKVYTSHTK
ncbi:hypothetical protein GMA11_01630 [Granulicatella sp. zg-ZJ]|uniref:FUSC family protein n=1 Tax=unclassified Granulicatella TaxID=2630493 RepID=UPI0013C24774|nr:MULTISPECIES: aromatic acid exporter family protein [unclassified Granulicatella]MBS4749916.1 FUSC family protein [Carnobacteriaceae bacterium zg-ZUI78]NEW62086.1 hypothetical protein [Granulicatella sp. zg-ZJ]NEW66405.1 hypothetical protein [Granulicatella sp. zg-84]QMI86127.1 FUSC family protein [Carnobacteriaceae bacterium zg-84]